MILQKLKLPLKELILFFLFSAFFISYFYSISFFQIFGGIILLYTVKEAIQNNLFKEKIAIYLALLLFLHPLLLLISTLLFGVATYDHLKYSMEQLLFSIPFFFIWTVSLQKRKRLILLTLKYLIPISLVGGISWMVVLLYKTNILHNNRGIYGNLFATGSVLALPFIFSLYLTIKNSTKMILRPLYFFLALFFSYGILVAERRSYMIAYGVAASLLLYYFIVRNQKRFFQKLILISLIGAIITAFTILSWSNLSNKYTIIRRVDAFLKSGVSFQSVNQLSSSRAALTTTSLEIVKSSILNRDFHHLIGGWGFGSIQKYKQTYSIETSLDQGLKAYETGIVFLNEFMHIGILGLIASLLFYIYVISIIRKAIAKRDLLAISIGAILTINLIYRFFTWYQSPHNLPNLILLSFLTILVGYVPNRLKKENMSISYPDPSKLIWPKGYASICDNSDLNSPLRNYRYRNIKENNIVWVRAVNIEQFFKEIYPSIAVRFLLVTSDNYRTIPDDLRVPNLNEILKEGKIIHWFAQNLKPPAEQADLFSAIPMGLDFHSAWDNSGWRFNKRLTPGEQERQILEIYEQSPKFQERKLAAFGDFHLNNTSKKLMLRDSDVKEDRTMIYNLLKERDWVHFSEGRMVREQFWEKLAGYQFIISPHGVGLDCHRTWEALLLGCMVLVKTSPLDALYNHLPVIIVNDYNEITKENLEIWSKTFSNYHRNDVLERLQLNYQKREMLKKI